MARKCNAPGCGFYLPDKYPLAKCPWHMAPGRGPVKIAAALTIAAAGLGGGFAYKKFRTYLSEKKLRKEREKSRQQQARKEQKATSVVRKRRVAQKQPRTRKRAATKSKPAASDRPASAHRFGMAGNPRLAGRRTPHARRVRYPAVSRDSEVRVGL